MKAEAFRKEIEKRYTKRYTGWERVNAEEQTSDQHNRYLMTNQLQKIQMSRVSTKLQMSIHENASGIRPLVSVTQVPPKPVPSQEQILSEDKIL